MTRLIDVSSLPLYYISFSPSEKIEKHYRDNGFTNVRHFKAVDGRRLDPYKLKDDNLITIRSFDDLIAGRREHSGMPSLGAIGCTLSHYELWNKCIDSNWPYIIIAEEDNRMYGPLSKQDEKDIIKAITKENGIFMSVKIRKKDHRLHFFGTHFYIASFSACKQLAKNCFPIDVQTDWYMAHLGTTKELNMEGYRLSKQSKKGSQIQDDCILCWLPTNIWYYIIFIIFVILLIILIFKSRKSLSECRDSCSV